MEKTKEVALLEKKVMPLISAAEDQIVETADDMKKATEVLSNLGRYYDSVVEAREKITAPLNAALKAARGMFDPIEKPAKAAMDGLRQRIGAYQTAETKRVADDKAKIAQQVGPGKGKLKPETAVRQMNEVKGPEKSVATDAGMLKFRTDKVLKITDENLIPREYLLVNEKAVLLALKNGAKVPGAEIEEKQVPVNIR